MTLTPIQSIQGSGLESPLASETVRTRGVVTGNVRKGYFIQDPAGSDEPGVSSGLFVYSRGQDAPLGALIEVEGKVLDFAKEEGDRPTTQLQVKDDVSVIDAHGPEIAPVWLMGVNIPVRTEELARFLNGLEGMLVGVRAGAVFIAASNPFGDYVVAPADVRDAFNSCGGILLDASAPERWFPSFRIIDYKKAPQINVGSTLLESVSGPLNYRSAAYQIAVDGPIETACKSVQPATTQWTPDDQHITILTLNGFNLDANVEDPSKVKNRRLDVDDDLGDGRFGSLAQAIVEQAGGPDIVALQEIQDNDGAELTEVVDASETYKELIRAVRQRRGPTYSWAEVPPQAGDDGGQPGGNIRNAFLYRRDRVDLIEGSLRRFGVDSDAFEGSRKPLMACFRAKATGSEIVVINLHLASKRHQHSIFSPEQPGFDPRLEIRVQQAEVVRDVLLGLIDQGVDYYVTGDFNDYEFSQTLRAMTKDESVNLLETLPPDDRFDYNHRGKLQALMHGIVSMQQAAQGRTAYETLHGNELIGVKPGEMGTKPTDHAYVLARLAVG
jgi:predicted extracellular nuclease